MLLLRLLLLLLLLLPLPLLPAGASKPSKLLLHPPPELPLDNPLAPQQVVAPLVLAPLLVTRLLVAGPRSRAGPGYGSGLS